VDRTFLELHAAVRVRVTQGNGDFVDQLLRAIEPVDDPK
jgi:hypothetical protein